MTSIQRLIKLVADAIAIGLVVAIIGGTATALLAVTGIKSLKNEIHEIKQNEEFTLYTVEEIPENITLELLTASLAIETGDKFSVYCSDGIRVRNKKGTLRIEDTVKELLSISNSHSIVVTLPKDMTFNKANISSGSGSIYIEKLVCDKLDLDLGVGKTEFSYIKANTSADVDGGVGDFTVRKGLLNNLDYSVGVGKSDITAKITGVSEIEAGIGDVKVNLTGGEKLYTIKGETGIGVMRVGNQRLSDGGVIGEGKNVISVEGGIGAVRIDFAE